MKLERHSQTSIIHVLSILKAMKGMAQIRDPKNDYCLIPGV